MIMTCSSCSPQIQKYGADPASVQWKVVRGDTATLEVEFLEVDVTNKRHKIPYIKVGTKVFYLKSDLDAWLLSNKVGA